MRAHDSSPRERPDDVVGSVGLERARDGIAAPVGGNEDHGQAGERRKRFYQRDAVGARAGQPEIQQDQTGLLVSTTRGTSLGAAVTIGA